MLVARPGSVRSQNVVTLLAITSLTEDGRALSFIRDNGAVNPATKVPASGIGYDPAAHWFAAYTTPRHEKAVVRQLDVRHVESFLPLYKSVRRWKNGCRVAVEQPLFPSYVFVRVRRRDSVKVLQVPGVLAIVSSGRQPAPLLGSEIESLRLGLPYLRFEPHPYLVVGEKVRIISGSLAGMVGVFVRKKNDFRVVLTLDLIQQSVAVEIGVNEVEPVKP